MNILEEANEIVNGDRQDAYGTPIINHTRTARMWSAYLGVPILPHQVCDMNSLQKISRNANAPKRDNYVDLAGYAWNAQECLESETEYEPQRTAINLR